MIIYSYISKGPKCYLILCDICLVEGIHKHNPSNLKLITPAALPIPLLLLAPLELASAEATLVRRASSSFMAGKVESRRDPAESCK